MGGFVSFIIFCLNDEYIKEENNNGGVRGALPPSDVCKYHYVVIGMQTGTGRRVDDRCVFRRELLNLRDPDGVKFAPAGTHYKRIKARKGKHYPSI